MPLTAFGIPFTVILFYAFFLDFPREVEEAATIDGCSKIQIFYKIIIPLSGPAIASAAIFQTVWIWNEFLLDVSHTFNWFYSEFHILSL